MSQPPEDGVDRAVLVLMVGAPGTGKSYFARQLSAALGATLVQTDVLRKQRFRPPRYTPEEHAAVYAMAHARLRRLLARGRSAVFDATNLIEGKRRALYRLADEAGARLVIVWTYAPEDVVRQRLVGRVEGRDATDVSDADWRVYQMMREREDPIPRPHFVVNTAVSPGGAVRRLVLEARTGER